MQARPDSARPSPITTHQSASAGLAEELRRTIRGEVRFDSGSRALYAADGSNYREVPIGIVLPRDVEDITQTILTANRDDAPILPRGCGTSLAGQCCNVAVVMDMSQYFHGFIAIDPQKRLATARPGIVLDDLRARAAKYGLTFGPDPATYNRCTIGGMIGNNSRGVHSVMAQFAGTGARTSDKLEALEILTYSGLCMRVGRTSEEDVNVDMATYKAEFLAHYYKGRLRPMHAYAFGLIHVWARFASLMPVAANFFSRAPIFRTVFKWVIGVAPERNVPAFAEELFKKWFRQRPAGPNEQKPPVVLWPDTFNNYFHRNTAKAAVEVLEHAGFRVLVPEQDMCCGRPLYDYGMLDTAERWLKQMLRGMQPHVRAGTPVVVLEPSCYAVFKDELPNLLPNDEDAKRLREQTLVLAEFLNQHAPNYELPKLRRKALAHGHCHQKAFIKMTAEEKVLKKMGLYYEVLDSGCCGMAGAFGFEAEHYDTSIKVGELVLLPAVRKAARDMLLVADGLSCREQISQTTDRHALHLAQVVQMAINDGACGPSGDYPEAKYVTPPPTPIPRFTSIAILAGGVLLGVAVFRA